ncbi:hypothetical protein BMG05_00070 [Mycobacterium malmoense]|nr:hypothetical protein BMG05_00070 [Mycobacterium malmoense]
MKLTQAAAYLELAERLSASCPRQNVIDLTQGSDLHRARAVAADVTQQCRRVARGDPVLLRPQLTNSLVVGQEARQPGSNYLGAIGLAFAEWHRQ